MRRIISIFFLSLMLLQAIPASHLFSSQNEIFNTIPGEEKIEEISEEKKQVKETLFVVMPIESHHAREVYLHGSINNDYDSPLLDFSTPPPDLN